MIRILISYNPIKYLIKSGYTKHNQGYIMVINKKKERFHCYVYSNKERTAFRMELHFDRLWKTRTGKPMHTSKGERNDKKEKSEKNRLKKLFHKYEQCETCTPIKYPKQSILQRIKMFFRKFNKKV